MNNCPWPAQNCPKCGLHDILTGCSIEASIKGDHMAVQGYQLPIVQRDDTIDSEVIELLQGFNLAD